MRWRNIESLRLYNEQGVELSQGYLKFLKDKSVLYASNGKQLLLVIDRLLIIREGL